jgi:hypothetical protein
MIFGVVDISDALLDEMKDRAWVALSQLLGRETVSIGVFTRIRLQTLT